MKKILSLKRTLLLCALASALPAWSQAQPSPQTVEQLRAELERRDAIISDLLQRVQALEQRAGVAQAPSSPPPAPAARRVEAQEAADEALLERALERSLVVTGSALLPRGAREIEPSFAYDYTQRSGVVLVGNGVAARSLRKEDYTGSLAFRAGLPWSSQLDVAVPFTEQRIDTVFAGIPSRSTDSGVGDVQVAFTKQFLNERDSRFALLGGVAWVHSITGDALRGAAAGLPDFATPAAVGSGHDSWVAKLVATKRIDPLVFAGSLSYGWSRKEDIDGVSVKAGNVGGGSVRAILAASPDVSLRAGLSLAKAGKLNVNGIPIEGTRTTASVLELGTSIVLSRTMLLDVSLGIGLTSDSPDFLFGVSLPLRF